MTTSIQTRTPHDGLLQNASRLDVISPANARTLDEMFRERVRRCPEQVAYRQYDALADAWLAKSWAEVAAQVERWQVALREQGLEKGDRVAVCYKNSIEWVVFDQAALRLGLVVVPLYTADRPDNMAWVLSDSGTKLLLLENAELWPQLLNANHNLDCVETVVVPLLVKLKTDSRRMVVVSNWLPRHGQHFERGCAEPEDLASIVYTSGTTGRPKGVMLTHRNMLHNAYAGIRSVPVQSGARVLSFLPLSHTFERTVGYYTSALAGAQVCFSRGVTHLVEDLRIVQPNVVVAVPQVFDKIRNQILKQVGKQSPIKRKLFQLALDTGWHRFEYQQGRAKWRPRLLLFPILDRLVCNKIKQRFGGRLDTVVVGGAPLSPTVSKTFISLGIPLLQGYGLTESSPVISVNTRRQNKPHTIGLPLRGVELDIRDNDELCVRGDNVMVGYWGLPEASAAVLQDGWLKTGDRAAVDNDGYLRIIGRIKDILVLANGEKIAPPDIERAILRDDLFEQVLVLGEGQPYLSALAVLNVESWKVLSSEQGWQSGQLNSKELRNELLTRISLQMDAFPGYAKIRRVYVCDQEWSIENGLLTPTMKMKRDKILDHYADAISKMYHGHHLQP